MSLLIKISKARRTKRGCRYCLNGCHSRANPSYSSNDDNFPKKNSLPKWNISKNKNIFIISKNNFVSGLYTSVLTFLDRFVF